MGSLRSTAMALGMLTAAAASCVAPYVGMDLTIEDCGSGAAFTAFDWKPGAGHNGCVTCGALALRQSPGLCVTVNGTNPSTGSPNLAAGLCLPGEYPTASSWAPCCSEIFTTLVGAVDFRAGDESQAYLYFDNMPTLSIMSIATASCLEVEGGINCVSAGCRIEQYGCNGGPNQAWTYNNATGALSIRETPSLCLAACRG
jgi:hypothetical protein